MPFVPIVLDLTKSHCSREQENDSLELEIKIATWPLRDSYAIELTGREGIMLLVGEIDPIKEKLTCYYTIEVKSIMFEK